MVLFLTDLGLLAKMKNEDNLCRKCEVKPPGHVKVIAYYANGKPVYHRLCDDCMKTRWEDMKKELPQK